MKFNHRESEVIAEIKKFQSGSPTLNVHSASQASTGPLILGCEICMNNLFLAEGKGWSKKEAEQKAALSALGVLKEIRS